MKKVEFGSVVRDNPWYASVVQKVEGDYVWTNDVKVHISDLTFLPEVHEMSEKYKEGWNACVKDVNTKLPRQSKKNEEFLLGFNDCYASIRAAELVALNNQTTPIRPTIIK